VWSVVASANADRKLIFGIFQVSLKFQRMHHDAKQLDYLLHYVRLRFERHDVRIGQDEAMLLARQWNGFSVPRINELIRKIVFDVDWGYAWGHIKSGYTLTMSDLEPLSEQ
jgi:hypothetical protein